MSAQIVSVSIVKECAQMMKDFSESTVAIWGFMDCAANMQADIRQCENPDDPARPIATEQSRAKMPLPGSQAL